MSSNHLTRRTFLNTIGAAAAASLTPGQSLAASSAPKNIVLIYADDLGYGDVSCYGATKFKTPNIDRLAANGIRFSNAHSSSATCTPSRYSLLTGEYAWRRKGTGILPGNAKMIIEPGRDTLPSMLKNAGYKTGVVGKWHLGLGDGTLDWNSDIKPGPNEIGFDYSFLIPATGDRVPCVYVENHRVVDYDPSDPIEVSFGKPIGDEPTGKEHPELLKMHPSHGHDMTIVNGISRIGYMSGGQSARWVDEDMADVITKKANKFITNHKDEPFFLYFSTHDIHVPRVPHSRFVGQSGLGPRGDAVMQLDWCVGEIMATLDRLDLTNDTLVLFASDNGPVVDDGYHDQAVTRLNGHTPSGNLRGGKYSSFDAGTRTPFIAHWPGRIQPGESDALVSQIDLFASFASLTGQALSTKAAPDSLNALPTLLGETNIDREHLIEHAGSLSIIQGDWKYIAPSKGATFNKNVSIELGNNPEPQLYNLKEDLGETNNLAAQHPEIVQKLSSLLAETRKNGRTRK
ncbi:MAG: arylsulfatase [Candidatus Hinthialibacter antarcticus]|nr:arylsulfatase [Candidatus Hinthialibacter antarcticus]